MRVEEGNLKKLKMDATKGNQTPHWMSLGSGWGPEEGELGENGRDTSRYLSIHKIFKYCGDSLYVNMDILYMYSIQIQMLKLEFMICI